MVGKTRALNLDRLTEARQTQLWAVGRIPGRQGSVAARHAVRHNGPGRHQQRRRCRIEVKLYPGKWHEKAGVMGEASRWWVGRGNQGSHCLAEAQRKNVDVGEVGRAPGRGFPVLQELEDNWENPTKGNQTATLGIPSAPSARSQQGAVSLPRRWRPDSWGWLPKFFLISDHWAPYTLAWDRPLSVVKCLQLWASEGFQGRGPGESSYSTTVFGRRRRGKCGSGNTAEMRRPQLDYWISLWLAMNVLGEVF